MLTSKLYGICLVKNEDDIIAQTLTYALRYCTRIFVIDNGSTDETWRIVQSLSEQYPQVVPMLQTHESFNNALRALAYNKYHADFSDSDWWMILDSDEFLAEDPHPVIQSAMHDKAEIIRSWQAQFYFTDIDYQNWLSGRESRDLPIFLRRRFYLVNWQETRLFRNNPARCWNANVSKFYPDGFRKVCKRRILNRHYQFRDPEQIQKRLSLRFGNPLFPHVTQSNWQSVIVHSKRLNYYKDGEPWHFSASGLIYYYKFVLKSWYRAAVERLGCIASLRRKTAKHNLSIKNFK
jgi:glycosyltransferase involved in cell wall biosynthesis